MFYLTKYPINSRDYYGKEDGSEWGRTNDIYKLLDTDDLIPVKISEHASEDTMVPRNIRLFIAYKQNEKNEKYLLDSFVEFYDFCTITHKPEEEERFSKYDPPVLKCNSTNYTLDIQYYPLNWFELFNLFEFNWPIYLFFVGMIFLGLIIIGFIFWLFHRIITLLRSPPCCNCCKLFAAVLPNSLIGIITGLTPLLWGCGIIWIWFKVFSSDHPVEEPNPISFEGKPGDWSDTAAMSEETIAAVKNGRMGTCFLIVGVYIIFQGLKMFIPTESFDEKKLEEDINIVDIDDTFYDSDEDKKRKYSKYWRPHWWKRSYFFFYTMLCLIYCLTAIEFSFSHWFKDRVFLFIGIMKICQLIITTFYKIYLRDFILAIPLDIMVTFVPMFVALSAYDLLDFVYCYFIIMGCTIVDRMYITPLILYCVKRWPKWVFAIRRKCKNHHKMSQRERIEEEAEWRRLKRLVELDKESVEPIIENFAMFTVDLHVYYLIPFALLLIRVFHIQCPFYESFDIKISWVYYYVIYFFILLVAVFIMEIFLLSAMELLYGYRMTDFLRYDNERFRMRECQWSMYIKKLDDSLTESLRIIDKTCFSSQYYFMNTLYVSGIFAIIIGYFICTNVYFNPLSDPMFFPLLFFMFIFVTISKYFLIVLCQLLRIWSRKEYDGYVDDDAGEKSSLGIRRSLDVEKERLELNALNSDRFRLRFLTSNKTWILDHLYKLLTPRTLDAPLYDDKSTREYIKAIYNKLRVRKDKFGEGEEVSDDEDAEEKFRTGMWERKNITPKARDIAKYWLEKVRRRRIYKSYIDEILENNKEEICSVCNRKFNSDELVVDLCDSEGKILTHGLEDLINRYERDTRSTDDIISQFDWQFFFRKNANYVTRCKYCKNEAQLEKGIHQEEYSDEESDEDEFENVYDPIEIKEGTTDYLLLKKWLTIMRTKYQIEKPSDEAIQESEDYKQKCIEDSKRRDEKRKEKRARRAYNIKLKERSGEISIPHDRLYLSSASKAMAIKWITSARMNQREEVKDSQRSLSEDINICLTRITEAHDKFYGKDLRMEGMKLHRKILDIMDERNEIEEEEENLINECEKELADFEENQKKLMVEDNEQIEKILLEELEKCESDISRYVEEMNELKRQKQIDYSQQKISKKELEQFLEEIESDVSSYKVKHGEEYDKFALGKRDELERRKNRKEKAIEIKGENVHKKMVDIRRNSSKALSNLGKDWIPKARKWLEVANKKIEEYDSLH